MESLIAPMWALKFSIKFLDSLPRVLSCSIFTHWASLCVLFSVNIKKCGCRSLSRLSSIARTIWGTPKVRIYPTGKVRPMRPFCLFSAIRWPTNIVDWPTLFRITRWWLVSRRSLSGFSNLGFWFKLKDLSVIHSCRLHCQVHAPPSTFCSVFMSSISFC